MMTLKQSLKKNILTRSFIKLAHRWYFAILYASLPELAVKYIYHRNTGKILNLKDPKDFNEKLEWLNLYWQNPSVVKCSDKYEVRDYALNAGCEKLLNQIYGIYEHASEINWGSLPKKFVLKCTHGCGFNVICDDKDKLDINQTSIQLDKWLKIRLDKFLAEMHYSKIKPRIICEQYLETDAGFLPIDYKIYCFNGTPKLVLVCTDRKNNLKFNFMDLNWEKMNIGSGAFISEDLPKKPKCFDDMIKYSEILSAPFPFVRIDFYDFKGKPILGEMTFTPGGNMADYYNETGLKLLGEMLKLPVKYDARLSIGI